MRVAVVSCLESVPWIPIVAALLEGFRDRGHDCRAFPMNPNNTVHLVELEAFDPDLALFPCHRAEWKAAAPYVELVKRLGSRTAAVAFDDPYDHETGLAMGRELGTVFTPEPLCVDVYRREGIDAFHLRPTISRRLHYPPTELEALAPRPYDVFHVGGNHWTPRRSMLPSIRAWCRATGRVYGECAGRRRWVVGRDLTRLIWQTSVMLEIPRFDLPTRSNPHQVPCTYTGPRVYLVAACGGLPLVIGPRADLRTVFPEVPSVPDVAAALDVIPDLISETPRPFWGAYVYGRDMHHPAMRAGQIMRELGMSDAREPEDPGPPPPGPRARSGSTSPPDGESAGAPATPPPG